MSACFWCWSWLLDLQLSWTTFWKLISLNLKAFVENLWYLLTALEASLSQSFILRFWGSFGLSPRPFAANTLAREPCSRCPIITVKGGFNPFTMCVLHSFSFYRVSPFFSPFLLLCFGSWVFRQSSCANFALARCISRLDYCGGDCGWNSVAQALVASWLQKWWKSAVQAECQALRTVKNKTPGVQLRTNNCKWACTKILKKYTKLHSLMAALKVFPNWSSSWCCWSAGQNATLKVESWHALWC